MISLQENEIIKYQYDSLLNLTISCTLGNKTLSLTCLPLIFTNKQLIIQIPEKQKIFYAFYQNIISYGISETGTLICEVFNEKEQEQFEQSENEILECELGDIVEDKDFVSEKDNPINWIELCWNLQLEFDFSKAPKEELQQAYNKFYECSAENFDRETSELDGPLDDELITANEIDENCLIDFRDNNKKIEENENKKDQISDSESEEDNEEKQNQEKEFSFDFLYKLKAD